MDFRYAGDDIHLPHYWPRLMGLVHQGSQATASGAVALAASWPTMTSIPIRVGQQLVSWGIAAYRAAKDWWTGGDPNKIEIPKVPGPSAPNLDGGPPGYFTGAVLLKETQQGNVPAVFSTNRLPFVQEIIERLDDFVRTLGSEYDRLKNVIDSIVDNWIHGRRDKILPMWLYERI